MQETIPLVGRASSNELRCSQALCENISNKILPEQSLIAILIALNIFCTYGLQQTLFNEGLKSVEIPLQKIRNGNPFAFIITSKYFI